MTSQKKKEKYKFRGYLQSKKTIINNQAFNYLYAIKDFQGVKFYRYEDEILTYFENNQSEQVSLYFVYNLYEFIVPLLPQLQKFYQVSVLAQNSVSWYSIDFIDAENKTKFRIWDVSFMRKGDLNSWAEAVSIKRINYSESVVRNRETHLYKSELEAITQNFEIIENYLQLLCNSFTFLKFEDFGVKAITKTSITRLYMQRMAGNNHYQTKRGRDKRYDNDYFIQCQSEKFKSYEEYAIAKASFRGGLAFTSEVCASRLLENVKEIDVCSCYHACMMAHRVPVKWKRAEIEDIKNICDYIKEFTYSDILNNFSNPFHSAFNAKFKFKNLRRKQESCFDMWRIATLATEKFQFKRLVNNEKQAYEDEYARNNGFIDSGTQTDFLFSKLVSARECDLFLTELEFWILCQVYDFESYEVLAGYVSYNSIKPPSLIVSTSFNLYHYKSELKAHNKQENSVVSKENYDFIKAIFNSLYGVQVQSPFYPQYFYDGKLKIDDDTVIAIDNFNKINAETKYRSMFNYGIRISGWSRVVLVIALLLLYENTDINTMCVAGDTDSLFIKTNRSMDNLLEVIKPLHKATQKSIIQLTNRCRKTQRLDVKDYVKHVGLFESELDNIQWDYELWNKGRILCLEDGSIKTTLAGVPQLKDNLSIASFMKQKLAENVLHETKDIVQSIVNYNTEIDAQLTGSCSFEDVKLLERVDDLIEDYQGNKEYVVCYATCWQKPQNLIIGDSSKYMSFRNVCELERQGIDVDDILKLKYIKLVDDEIIVEDEDGNKIL